MVKIYPNAKVGEVKKKARKMRYPPREGTKKYEKGNFMYLVSGEIDEVIAMHKPTKTMFKWSTKTRMWRKVSYSPGRR